MIRYIVSALLMLGSLSCFAQNFREEFDKFRNQIKKEYNDFRQEANQRYADYLSEAWERYKAMEPIERPKEATPLPPLIYVEPVLPQVSPLVTPDVEPITPPLVQPEIQPTVPPELEPIIIPKENQAEEPVEEQVKPAVRPDGQPIIKVTPIIVPLLAVEPQPVPVEPIKEKIEPNPEYFTFSFLGNETDVRLPKENKIVLKNLSGKTLGSAWEQLSNGDMDNLLYDCLKIREENNLCDWAYLLMLEALAKAFYGDTNEATMLMAWLYCQSGYQMRLASASDQLVMLYGSKHLIYDSPSYVQDGATLYPFRNKSSELNISKAKYPGEKQMSLLIDKEPVTGNSLSKERNIISKKYPEINMLSQVKNPLIDFFNTYPTSALDGNLMTRWAMYANTPLSIETKEKLYPKFKQELQGMSELESTQRILNWVQTGLEYKFDDEVWGGDRAFFAEETLYYPYCDCEDRAILFSRLVRDLLGLDVALVYYPGHLAAAVNFNEKVSGDAMVVNGKDFIVCDPTFIGAPVGVQMPNMDYNRAQAIVLKKN